VLDVRDGRTINETRSFDTRDGLYDCTWSEENENIIAAASGDGSIKVWDIAREDPRPIRSFEEHSSEVYSVDWNQVNKKTMVSG
jgi:peroxin-7